MKKYLDKIEKLQKENYLLMRAVEFYGDTDNWWWETGYDKDTHNVISEDLERIETSSRTRGYEMVGGKLARETIEEIKRLRNEG